MQPAIRATALALTSESIESFLQAMKHISEGVIEERKPMTANQSRQKKGACRNCGKKDHQRLSSRIVMLLL